MNLLRTNFILTIFVLFTFKYCHSQSLQVKLDELMNKYHKNDAFNGNVLIEKDGDIIFEKSYGIENRSTNTLLTSNSLFKIKSDTKTFTAELILILVSQNKIALTDKVQDYIPELSDPKFIDITIHHLLSNTSGIPHDARFEIKGFNWDEHIQKETSPEEWAQLISKSKILHEPGEKFTYSSPNFHLLGLIIERVTQQSYSRNLQQLITTPLGLHDTFLPQSNDVIKNFAFGYRLTTELDEDNKLKRKFKTSPYRHNSSEYAAGGMVSTARDMLRFYQAIENNELVNRELQKLMFKKHILLPDDWTMKWYGYGISINDEVKLKFGYDILFYTHGGYGMGHRSMVFSIPKQNLRIVTLSNDSGAANHWNINFNLVQIINNGDLMPLNLDPFNELSLILVNEGVEKAWAFLMTTTQEATLYNYSESTLNRGGYFLIEQNLIDHAIEIFKMNIELFPNSWNVYDSLAEAYLLKGNKALALKNYLISKKKGSQNPKIDTILFNLKN